MFATARGAAVALLLIVPPSLDAQQPDSVLRRRAALARLADNQKVRLAGPRFGVMEGRLLERSASELVLGSQSRPLRVPAVTIDTMWTRGGSTKAGAIVGAVLGLGIGLLVGNTFGEENAGSARNIIGMGATGMLGGGLLGAIIGTPIPRWSRRFP